VPSLGTDALTAFTAYLAPEIVFLFKAKRPREKDEADFHGVFPLLDHGQQRWLDDALAMISSAHPWRPVIAGDG
jgi:hypothetical protein